MPATVKKGSSGSDVTLCQERLNAHGYPCAVDGYFGSQTESVTIQFQQNNGLTPDGIVGDKTWSKLLEAVPSGPPFAADLDPLSLSMTYESCWYLGWDYATGSQPSLVAQPSRLAPSNVVWAPGKKTKTVCCVFVAGVMGRVYDKTAQWTPNAWSRFMILDPAQPWSMADECIAAGVARTFSGTPIPGKWYILQGWNGLQGGQVVAGSTGHQFFLWGPDLVLEATTYTDEDADGSSTDPGAVAWRHRAWSATVSRYQEIRVVELV
jgi:hypothetical protein